MTSAQRLQALRGIEKRLMKFLDRIEFDNLDTVKYSPLKETEHLVNILITEELKDQQDADVSKIRKDGAN